ncbi:hypothetical protein F5050DRAFT_1776557 [Lentinula boryana]|uniref:Secreted protein n=1 Tax=Lentinula boryana TaxID=40481 RepID=A0ABQ8Q6L8_9AGAR|nr:hypothetical protein F5050DRAFT_1776557 [Lentinula boryana]
MSAMNLSRRITMFLMISWLSQKNSLVLCRLLALHHMGSPCGLWMAKIDFRFGDLYACALIGFTCQHPRLEKETGIISKNGWIFSFPQTHDCRVLIFIACIIPIKIDGLMM